MLCIFLIKSYGLCPPIRFLVMACPWFYLQALSDLPLSFLGRRDAYIKSAYYHVYMSGQRRELILRRHFGLWSSIVSLVSSVSPPSTVSSPVLTLLTLRGWILRWWWWKLLGRLLFLRCLNDELIKFSSLSKLLQLVIKVMALLSHMTIVTMEVTVLPIVLAGTP